MYVNPFNWSRNNIFVRTMVQELFRMLFLMFLDCQTIIICFLIAISFHSMFAEGTYRCTVYRTYNWLHTPVEGYVALSSDQKGAIRSIWGIQIPNKYSLMWSRLELRIEFPNHLPGGSSHLVSKL